MNLQDLIAHQKAGRSYDQLATACGGTPTSGRLQQIATSRLRSFPDPDTIRGLHRGLSVPERVVVTAAAESLGLDVATGTSRLETWLPTRHPENLTDAQVAAVLTLVQTMVTATAPAQRVDGGVLLLVEKPADQAYDGRDMGAVRNLLESVYPDPAGDLERAILYLSQAMATAMGDLRRDLTTNSAAVDGAGGMTSPVPGRAKDIGAEQVARPRASHNRSGARPHTGTRSGDDTGPSMTP